MGSARLASRIPVVLARFASIGSKKEHGNLGPAKMVKRVPNRHLSGECPARNSSLFGQFERNKLAKSAELAKFRLKWCHLSSCRGSDATAAGIFVRLV